MKHKVIPTKDLVDGDHVIIELEGREIGVFNVDGEYVAYTNWCAHQSGPICEGNVTGTTQASYDSETLRSTFTWEKEGEILNCPWHGWEYDLKSGTCLSKQGVSLVSHTVEIEDGNVVVEL